MAYALVNLSALLISTRGWLRSISRANPPKDTNFTKTLNHLYRNWRWLLNEWRNSRESIHWHFNRNWWQASLRESSKICYNNSLYATCSKSRPKVELDLSAPTFHPVAHKYRLMRGGTPSDMPLIVLFHPWIPAHSTSFDMSASPELIRRPSYRHS